MYVSIPVGGGRGGFRFVSIGERACRKGLAQWGFGRGRNSAGVHARVANNTATATAMAMANYGDGIHHAGVFDLDAWGWRFPAAALKAAFCNAYCIYCSIRTMLKINPTNMNSNREFAHAHVPVGGALLQAMQPSRLFAICASAFAHHSHP